MAGPDQYNWEAIGRAIARGMREGGNSTSFGADRESDSSKKVSDEVDKFIKRQRRVHDATEDTTDHYKKLNKILTQNSIVQNKEIKNLKVRYKSQSDHLRKLERKLRRTTEGSEDYNAVLTELESVTKERVQTEKRLVDAHNKLNSAVGAVVGAVVGAMAVLADDVMVQLRRGSQMGVIAMQGYTAALGISTETLTELEAENRQALNAMGGTANALQNIMTGPLGTVDMELVKLAGGFDEATEFFTNSMSSLANAGIKPSMSAFGDLKEDMKDYRRIFGMNQEQFVQMNNALAENQDIRYELQGLDEEQRRARMNEIRQTIELNGALGMTAEQAMAAAEVMASMRGQGAKDRIQAAARLQAMAAAYGIEGGAEAAEALRAGARATGPQRQILENVAKQLANMGAEVRQQGIGAELQYQTMLDQLGLEPYLGKGSPLITTMTEARRAEEGADLTPFNEEVGAGTEALIRFKQALNIFDDKFFGGLFKTLQDGLGGVAAAVGGGALLGRLFGGGGGITGLVGGALRSLFGGGSTKGPAGGILSKMLGSVQGLMSPAMLGRTAIGYGAYKAFDMANTRWFSTEDERQQQELNIGRFFDNFLSSVGAGDVEMFGSTADERLKWAEQEQQRLDEQTKRENEQKEILERQANTMGESTSLQREQIRLMDENNQLLRQLIGLPQAGDDLDRSASNYKLQGYGQ